MKRVLSLLLPCLLLLLASGCGQSAQAVPPASSTLPAVQSGPEETAPPGEPPAPAPESAAVTEVEVSHGASRIALTLPEGWEYEKEEYDGQLDNGGEFAIRFRPAGADGWVRVACSSLFGVCGTGLETEEITFGAGLTGTRGTYDGHAIWDYIFFSVPEDGDHSYVALTQGVEDWWPDFGDGAMEILASARLG